MAAKNHSKLALPGRSPYSVLDQYDRVSGLLYVQHRGGDFVVTFDVTDDGISP